MPRGDTPRGSDAKSVDGCRWMGDSKRKKGVAKRERGERCTIIGTDTPDFEASEFREGRPERPAASSPSAARVNESM